MKGGEGQILVGACAWPFWADGPIILSLSRNGSSMSTECMVQCNLGACEKDQPGLVQNAGFASTYAHAYDLHIMADCMIRIH